MQDQRQGRWTLGLYNSYDPHHFHEAMRRAVARAAPLCKAFGFNLAPIGFPFQAFRTKEGEGPQKATPQELATLLADSTTIGEGGEYLEDLARGGRFVPIGFPEDGFPPQLGTPVLCTRKPDPKKRITIREIEYHTQTGESFLFVVGLGPRGVPKTVHERAAHHLELSEGEYSLETATALGVLAGRLYEAWTHILRPENPPLVSDAVVVRSGQVLLVRRGREPFKGMWALPGGFVDPGEKTEDTCLRELREETGVRGSIQELVGVFSAPGRDPRGPTVSITYRVEPERGEPRGGDDAAEARYWDLGALPALAFDHDEILAAFSTQARKTKPQR